MWPSPLRPRLSRGVNVPVHCLRQTGCIKRWAGTWAGTLISPTYLKHSPGRRRDLALFWRQAKETAWLRILDHPQRAIRSNLHVADSVT
jgi:hypothetical protein